MLRKYQQAGNMNTRFPFVKKENGEPQLRDQGHGGDTGGTR
jgi:hypothetical protein